MVNHPGGGTAIGVRAAATSVPDGYTLFYALTASFVALPVLQPDLPFDVARDFVPIGLIGEQPMIIAVDPALGVNTLEELIALSKKRPGGLTCAVPTSGSLPHVTGEWFRRRAGADLTFIHYPGTAQSVLDVIGGRVSMLIRPSGLGRRTITRRTAQTDCGRARERPLAEPPGDVADRGETVPASSP